MTFDPFYADDWLTVYGGDCRAVMREMPAESVHCVVTSPPYWGLRDYGTPGQLGLEPTPEEYVAAMVAVFREVRRVLRDDGTVWLNLGDSYAGGGGYSPGSPSNVARQAALADGNDRDGAFVVRGEHNYLPRQRDQRVPSSLKPKDLVGIPWRVAFALQADGWYLRSDIIWAKPNPMPESVTDRPTKAHEYVFLLSKSARYFYDAAAVAEPATYSGPNGAQHSTYGQGFTRRSDKQRDQAANGVGNGHHVAGFNDRWDAKEADGKAPITRNLRSVWNIATAPYAGAHFATFPPKLVEPCIKAGCPTGGVVLDPFAGTGTVGMVAAGLSRRAVLIDLNPDYLAQCLERNRQTPLGLGLE